MGKTGGQINQVKFAAFEVGAALAESPGRWPWPSRRMTCAHLHRKTGFPRNSDGL